MGNVIGQDGTYRLEQVQIEKPEVRFYFTGDREQDGTSPEAWLGTEELSFRSLSRFSESGEGICLYVLLDVSASVPEETFSRITGGLSELASGLRTQDRMVLVTFGEEVRQVFDLTGDELSAGAGSEELAALKNTDQKTLLFEAVRQTAELAGQAPVGEKLRQAAFVITDGEDIARGKATKDEALNTLAQAGIPVYGFCAEGAGREAVNAFGEFSRTSGGKLTQLASGKEAENLCAVWQELMDSYEAVFEAADNRVSREMVSVTLEFADGEKRKTRAMEDRWQADTEKPQILSVEQEGESQLRLTFSEAVDGAEAAENYSLTDAGGTVLVPAFASVGSEGDSVLLTFSDRLDGGSYELSCSRITDRSMEGNTLEGTAEVTVEQKGEAAAETAPETTVETVGAQNVGKISPVLPGAAAAALFLAIWIGVWAAGKRKKAEKNRTEPSGSRKETDRTEFYGPRMETGRTENSGFPAESGGAAGTVFWQREQPVSVVIPDLQSDTHVHVAVERQALAEQKVYFHLSGQQEEFPVLIRSSLIVGRSSSCQLIFDDPALSRQHFALELTDEGIRIMNLSQSGYTMVNGQRIGAQPQILCSGDEIRAGQLVMTVRWTQ